ncbi:MAG: hypothetical protein KF802_13115 [Bdellovibrionaceae bacterium]|nr:hypothetical protein [Pseudobdellovibrionaceae bacterium]
MGMLDRYKKKGGFVQLLTLIETSGKQKQDQFLSLIAQENPVWEETIRKKTLTLEKILTWNSTYLSEVLSRVQPLTLATALNGMPKDKVDIILGCLSMTDKRKIQQVIDESKPTPAEINTCIMKIITETRGFISGGILKMDKVDPELMIPENIEEQLSNQSVTRSLGDLTASVSADPDEPKLNFDGPHAAADKTDVKAGSKEEVEFLKKKVNTLVSENNSLKQELSVVRGKLDQIRKIA